MSEQNTQYLIFGGGYWGRGATEHEAIANAKWFTKGSKVVMARCPEGTRVDEDGRIYTPKGTSLGDFIHGTVGGTAKNRKFVANKTQPA